MLTLWEASCCFGLLIPHTNLYHRPRGECRCLVVTRWCACRYPSTFFVSALVDPPINSSINPLQTSESYLVLVSVSYEGNGDVYSPPSLSLQTMRTFLDGPGEGLPFQPVSLHFEGVVRVEGDLLRSVRLGIIIVKLLNALLQCFASDDTPYVYDEQSAHYPTNALAARGRQPRPTVYL